MPPEVHEITLNETETQTEHAAPWHVIVYDDPVNLMGFVTLVLRRVFGYPQEKAEALMLEVHRNGLSVVWSGEREKAELYVQQLQAYLLRAAMKRS
jgi:ATP-dependent Clp protease adaptor protein ClpS